MMIEHRRWSSSWVYLDVSQEGRNRVFQGWVLGVCEGYSQLKSKMALIQGIVEAFRKYETLCTMVDGIRARRRWLVTVLW